MKSMTGFGRACAAADGNSVTIDISAVNHKNRDLRFSLPPELGFLEPQLKNQICAAIERGSINLTATYELAPEAQRQQIQVNIPAVEYIAQHLREVARNAGIQDDLRIGDLLAMPDIVAVHPQRLPRENIANLARKALTEALSQLSKVRQREGKYLQKDLQTRTQILENVLAQVEAGKDDVLKAYRQRLLERIKLLDVDVKLDDERLAKEVAFAAQKSDITEETIRLRAHLEQLSHLLQGSDAGVGRQLQFLCQEIQREINTLAAKTRETNVAALAIEFKAELERIREQICNVE
jgi:uncharacterized protein (TIGR00255 family)